MKPIKKSFIDRCLEGTESPVNLGNTVAKWLNLFYPPYQFESYFGCPRPGEKYGDYPWVYEVVNRHLLEADYSIQEWLRQKAVGAIIE